MPELVLSMVFVLIIIIGTGIPSTFLRMKRATGVEFLVFRKGCLPFFHENDLMIL